VTWDGRNAQGNSVATGVYFARMVAAASSGKQYKSTIKMMLVR